MPRDALGKPRDAGTGINPMGSGGSPSPCTQGLGAAAARCWGLASPLHCRHADSLAAPSVCKEGKYCMRWPRAGQEQARRQSDGSFCRIVPS